MSFLCLCFGHKWGHITDTVYSINNDEVATHIDYTGLYQCSRCKIVEIGNVKMKRNVDAIKESNFRKGLVGCMYPSNAYFMTGAPKGTIPQPFKTNISMDQCNEEAKKKTYSVYYMANMNPQTGAGDCYLGSHSNAIHYNNTLGCQFNQNGILYSTDPKKGYAVYRTQY